MEVNKYSRFQTHQTKIFDCYCEILPAKKSSNTSKPWIRRRFPDTYRVKDVLDSVPKFAFPTGSHNVDTVTHFSFVLTNIDSQWTFGYCKINPENDICFVILSHLPWHDTFFKILNHISILYHKSSINRDSKELLNFFKALHHYKTPEQSIDNITLSYETDEQTTKTINFDVPDLDSIPCIPQNINLTEYYNAVETENMIKIFASALNERHIIIVSRKLDRLTACVQAINELIYPMHWQHIFIPVLPSDLLAYLQAPMPFLIGVPDTTFKKLSQNEFEDSVILNVDDNVFKSQFDDLKSFPISVSNSIRSDLRGPLSHGDSVSRAFLRALVILIGGYREALEFNDGKKITFNHDRFISTRPASFEPFLRKMLELQMFRQFIDGRLEMLNSGRGFNDDFEFEVNLYEERTANKVNLQYQDWLNAMKKKSGVLLKSINPSFKLVCKGIKEKSQQAYRGWKVKLDKSPVNQATKFLYSRME